MDFPKPINPIAGEEYTLKFQKIKWTCHCCEADNETRQDVTEKDDLFYHLLLECNTCGKYHEIEKTVLEGE